MRNDAERIAKYLAKVVPATVSLKIAGVLDGMRSNFGPAAESIVDMETQVQAILNDDKVPTIQYPFYLSFGREIWKLIRNGIDGNTLDGMAQSFHDKYVDYGLATATLVRIADEVFNLVVT